MIRLIFLFMFDFFIGFIIINVFFEYVKCESKFVSINKELPSIKNLNNTFKSIKLFDGSKKKKKSNYLFLSKHNFRKKNDIVIASSTKKKNFLLKYQKRNHFLYRIICNHNFLILNNTSFLKPTKLTIFNHEAPKNNISPNNPEKEKKKNKALPTDKVNNKKEENVLPIDKKNDENVQNVLPIDKQNDENVPNILSIDKKNDENVQNILPIDKKNDENVQNVLPIDKQNDPNDNVTLPVNNLNEDQTNNLSLINNEENKNKKNVSENNDTWKKYLQDKRKKEILKDMENKRNNNNNNNNKKKKYNNEYIKNINKYTHNNNNNNSTSSSSSSNMCDISQKDELNENDEIIQDERNYFNDHNNDYYDDDNDYYDDDNDDNFIDDDDDYYNDEDNNYNEQYKDLEEQEKQYNNTQNGNFPYFNNINDTNKHFKNHKNYNEQNNNNNNNSSSLNDSLNNIFASNKKNDLPLFFSLNNKSFENSNNKYFDKICSISPNELINRFFENTSERVKDAVKNIIFNIIGNIQKYTIETSILITYEKIYNFLLQIILTGYMIKNADYRLSLNESLYDQNNILNKKDYDEQPDKQQDEKKQQINVNKEKQQYHEYQEEDLFNLKKSFHTLFSDNNINNNMSEEQLNKGDILNSKHIIDPDNNNIDKKDNIDNLQRNEESNDNYPIINTKNYILFLRQKINSLEKQLNMLKESKTFLNDDLLSYIKSLTEIQLRSLTDNIGPLVLDSTKKIVELVIQGMTLNINKNMSNELIYVSGSVLTYICFWQLIIGYTLREMEIRDELSDYLKGN
ncbi:conserved Plasmodium protein, unknown function [Plasmodium gaboni]|uniref:Uncharacterized protein n=1 Tax=Plasmodium gaboni TaxID=647221 RepID=A0ABY1UJ94_9APIC|nr:conserved Plasmodium protein, unknown function [Plasmodium gaboni]